MEKRKKAEKALSEQDIADIAFEFQESVVEVLGKKLVKSAIELGAKSIGIVGGVSANKRLEGYIADYLASRAGTKHKDPQGNLVEVELPEFLGRPSKMAYCTDNAGMIGVAGLIKQESKT